MRRFKPLTVCGLIAVAAISLTAKSSPGARAAETETSRAARERSAQVKSERPSVPAPISSDELAKTWSRFAIPMPGGQFGSNMLQAPAGIGIGDAITTLQSTGETASHIRAWQQNFSDEMISVRIDSRPAGQYSINQSVKRRDSRGCELISNVQYDRDGRVLRQAFWRADPARTLPGSMEFPADLCPFNGIADAVVPALGAPHPGATGVLNVQTSPWGFFQINVKATGPESVTVPAGTLSALKINSWVDLNSMYPSMPRVVARSIEAFEPANLVWIGASAPHQFLKFEGSDEGLGPKISIRMARIYTAASPVDIGTTHPVALIWGKDALEERLRARGLMGGDGAAARALTPPPGVEVREYETRLAKTNEVMFAPKKWDEPIDGGTMHVELTTVPTGQFATAFWVLASDPRQGCRIHGWMMYAPDGRPIQGVFWRNDPALQVPGAPNFPPPLFPENVGPELFFRALDSPRIGASGTLNQQIGTYSYAGLDSWVTGVERIKVPAGEFDAFKVVVRVNLRTLFPTWPGVFVSALQPFMPKNASYFQAQAPYRYVFSEGSPGFQAPETTTKLIRYYNAPVVAQPNLAAATASAR